MDKQWKIWMFRFAFVFTLVATSIAAIFAAPSGTVITLAAVGVAAMLFTRLNDLASFEGFGLKAELRETIEEANATIMQLQELAVAVSQPVITNLAIQGHFVQLKYQDRYEMREVVNSHYIRYRHFRG